MKSFKLSPYHDLPFYRATNNVERNSSTQQNTSYSITAAMSHSTTSGTPIQVTRVTSGDKSTSNYSSLGPTYEMIDSMRSDGRNQMLISERYEFADVQYQIENSGPGGVSTEENVFPGQAAEDEDYAYLQR